MPRLKILVLSVGSLLGQNILDALEGRREQVDVIGGDTGTTNARLFRCEVPSSNEEGWMRRPQAEQTGWCPSTKRLR
jgi:hypothetical protein